MLVKSKSNHSLIKTKDFSLLRLTTLSNFLQNQQNVTQDITKEINNEMQLSKKNERLIDKSMGKIKGQAEELVRRFEQEKEKHQKLQFLVSHIEQQIYNAKLDKSIELRQNGLVDELEELSSQLKTRERELQKICEKTNTSSYQLSKKEDAIRALRSQRTIVSQLLDKIERELCNLQHCYKVLVIESTIEDHMCQEKLKDFRKMETQANKQMEKVISTKKDIPQLQDEETRLQINSTNETGTLNRQSLGGITCQDSNSQNNLKQLSQFQMSKQKEKQKERKAKIQGDLIKLGRERTVKTILNQLGISSPKELPTNIQDLQSQNESTLALLAKLDEEIEKKEYQIASLNKRKRKNYKKEQSKKRQSHNKKSQLKEVIEEIRTNRLQSAQFKEITKIVCNSILENRGLECNQQFYNEEQQIKHYMSFLETFFQRSYQSSNFKHSRKEGNASKRLTSLLNAHHFQRNQMSIYEEQDLLEFAKRNLEKLEKTGSKSEKNP